MPASSSNRGSSEVDLKQRYLFLFFYCSAVAFSIMLILDWRAASSWHEVLRTLAAVTGAVALWNFYRLFSLSDERQRRVNDQAVRFGFLVTLALSLVGGFVRGFGSPMVSCGGLLAVMLILPGVSA